MQQGRVFSEVPAQPLHPSVSDAVLTEAQLLQCAVHLRGNDMSVYMSGQCGSLVSVFYLQHSAEMDGGLLQSAVQERTGKIYALQ